MCLFTRDTPVLPLPLPQNNDANAMYSSVLRRLCCRSATPLRRADDASIFFFSAFLSPFTERLDEEFLFFPRLLSFFLFPAGDVWLLWKREERAAVVLKTDRMKTTKSWTRMEAPKRGWRGWRSSFLQHLKSIASRRSGWVKNKKKTSRRTSDARGAPRKKRTAMCYTSNTSTVRTRAFLCALTLLIFSPFVYSVTRSKATRHVVLVTRARRRFCEKRACRRAATCLSSHSLATFLFVKFSSFIFSRPSDWIPLLALVSVCCKYPIKFFEIGILFYRQIF